MGFKDKKKKKLGHKQNHPQQQSICCLKKNVHEHETKQNRKKQQIADLVPFVLLYILLKLLSHLNLAMAVHYFLLVFLEEKN